MQTASEELAQVVELQKASLRLMQDALRSSGDNDAESKYPELEALQTRSMLLMAASVFEFALRQSAELKDRKKAASNAAREAAYTRYIRILLGPNFDDYSRSQDWVAVVSFFRVRGMIAHTTGYQDRTFTV